MIVHDAYMSNNAYAVTKTELQAKFVIVISTVSREYLGKYGRSTVARTGKNDSECRAVQIYSY